jgi:4-hydroxybenzoate polyprenyltransferase
MICYALTLLVLIVVGKWLLLGAPYYLGLMIAMGFAFYHYFLIRTREKSKCFQAFLHNNWFGLSVFAGFYSHYLIN